MLKIDGWIWYWYWHMFNYFQLTMRQLKANVDPLSNSWAALYHDSHCIFRHFLLFFYFCLGEGFRAASLEASTLLFTLSACSAPSPLEGKIHSRAAPAVPSPLWREKHKNVAQMKAQQPLKVVRTYGGTKAKFRNWGRQTKILFFLLVHYYT